MKFRYGFLCILVFLLNNQLFAINNTRFKEIKTITRQMLQDPAVKKTVIKINDIFSKQKTKEIGVKETSFIKRISCNFLLRVLIPAVLISSITYLLLFYYKITPLSLGPDFSSWKLLFTDLSQILKSYKWKLIEVFIAFLRLYMVGKDINNLFFDVLRIASSFLFLINKKQFSLQAFKNGAYYISSWLLYDTFHFMKTLYDDSFEDQNKPVEKKDFQFKKLEEIFGLYVLPFFEFVSVLLLALDSGETDKSLDTRNSIQALYSLIRIFSQYLKSKHFVINSLLALNVVIVGYNLWNDAIKNPGDDGIFGVENFDDGKPEEGEDDSKDEQDEDEQDEDEELDDDIEEDCKADESNTDKDKDKKDLSLDLRRVFYENLDSEKEVVALYKKPENMQDNMNFPQAYFVNGVLMNEIKTDIDDLIKKYPQFANLVNKVNYLSSDTCEEGDMRSLKIILEELLNRTEKFL